MAASPAAALPPARTSQREDLSLHMGCWHLTQLFSLAAHGFCVQVPGIGQAMMLPAMGGLEYTE